jgi:D-allose transport system substrate-binding protein
MAASASPAPEGARSNPKLIIFTLPFACGLNTYASQLCDGVKAAGKALPGFDVQIKTGTNYADTVAYNNLLQTSYQLNPGGVIAFVNGPAAQTPTLKQGCSKGIKVILIDSPATGMGTCQSSFVGSDHYGMGVADGKWLIKHPPANGSKEVAIVTQPPGEYASTDARVRGFTKTVEAAGYKVVATTIITDLGSDKNVSLVTNTVTAHPNLGAIFSANGPMGEGTAAALKNNKAIVQLTLDGDAAAIQALKTGAQNGANTVQDPFAEGRIAVTNMAKVIQGKKVAALTYTPSMTVDKTNVAKYIAAGGMR